MGKMTFHMGVYFFNVAWNCLYQCCHSPVLFFKSCSSSNLGFALNDIWLTFNIIARVVKAVNACNKWPNIGSNLAVNSPQVYM